MRAAKRKAPKKKPAAKPTAFVRRAVKARGPERIDPDIASLAVPIDDVKPWPGNPRQGDIGAMSEGLKRFGQRKPIVVQKSSAMIVAGNHTWKAAKALGWKSIAVNAIAVDDEEAVAFALSDNRIGDLASYDDAQLADLLKAVGEEGLPGTGYDADDVDALLKSLAVAELGDDAFGALPSGEKADFEQMTFTLHKSQAETVREALDAAKAVGPFVDAPNENSNGNALARMAGLALAGLR